MPYLIYVVIAALIGVALSFQPPINATMSRTVGSPLLAASISLGISLFLVIMLWLSLGKGSGDISEFRNTPWWVYVGGAVGVVFVAGSLIVAPVLGVSIFFVCVVAGQLLGATLIDQFGVFGLPVKSVNMMKVTGLGLVLLGAVLVQNSHS